MVKIFIEQQAVEVVAEVYLAAGEEQSPEQECGVSLLRQSGFQLCRRLAL